jgi:hypothetical protein
MLFRLMTISQNSADCKQCRIRKHAQYKVIDNFETFPQSTNILHPTNGSGVMITENCGRCQFWTDHTVWTNFGL